MWSSGVLTGSSRNYLIWSQNCMISNKTKVWMLCNPWNCRDCQMSVCLCMKFHNFKNLLDLCSGVSCVQVLWETLRIAALAAKLYLPVSCRAPLTFRLWSCSRSYNFVIKSGNFWTTQLVLRLITLLYDSLQLLYQSRGSQGLNTYCSRLGRSLSAK
jgi:hypothetical protein